MQPTGTKFQENAISSFTEVTRGFQLNFFSVCTTPELGRPARSSGNAVPGNACPFVPLYGETRGWSPDSALLLRPPRPGSHSHRHSKGHYYLCLLLI